MTAMFRIFDLALLAIALGTNFFVSGLGTSCSAPITQGTAVPGAPYWMETIKHQGTAAYNLNPNGYQVFRNVKVCRYCGLWACGWLVDSDSPLFRISARKAMGLQMIRLRSSCTPYCTYRASINKFTLATRYLQGVDVVAAAAPQPRTSLP